MTVFLQGALGMTPLEAGLTMMPMSLMLMFVAPIRDDSRTASVPAGFSPPGSPW